MPLVCGLGAALAVGFETFQRWKWRWESAFLDADSQRDASVDPVCFVFLDGHYPSAKLDNYYLKWLDFSYLSSLE